MSDWYRLAMGFLPEDKSHEMSLSPLLTPPTHIAIAQRPALPGVTGIQ
jgi:hypothetical protein